ncbi:TRAP transporter large permease subunit [Chloroflexota bacterium]
MEWPLILLLVLGVLIFLMLTGLPIAFCFLAINLVGVYLFFGGEAGFLQLARNMYRSLAIFPLLTIPLFILMGEVMFRSGIGFEVIRILDKWMGRLPGRLGLLAVAAGTLFGTTSGSTVASTAMLGTLLTPEMEKYGYKKPISIGAVMGSGGLAMIIPPSGLAVLLATIAEFSIGQLLIAGIIPGLVIATLYASYIIFRCWLQPSIAPSYEVITVPLREKIMPTIRIALPLGFIIFMVLGLIFIGVATPTEAAAMGVIGTLIMAAVYKKLNWKVVKESVAGTLSITVMVLLVITAAITFSQILAYSGVSRGLVALAGGLNIHPLLIMGMMQLVMLFLGTFMDVTAIMMVTIPIYMPIVIALGFNPIWFGLIMLINLEMAMTTPPFGILLFVMKGVAPRGTTLTDVIKAGLPFLLCDTTTMLLCLFFPILVLWLPNLMI